MVYFDGAAQRLADGSGSTQVQRVAVCQSIYGVMGKGRQAHGARARVRASGTFRRRAAVSLRLSHGA